MIIFGQALERIHHSTENVLDLAFCQSMRPSSLNSGVYVLNTGQVTISKLFSELSDMGGSCFSFGGIHSKSMRLKEGVACNFVTVSPRSKTVPRKLAVSVQR